MPSRAGLSPAQRLITPRLALRGAGRVFSRCPLLWGPVDLFHSDSQGGCDLERQPDARLTPAVVNALDSCDRHAALDGQRHLRDVALLTELSSGLTFSHQVSPPWFSILGIASLVKYIVLYTPSIPSVP